MTTMTLWQHPFVTIVAMLAWCSAALEAAEYAKPVEVGACHEASQLPPITQQCVAAAIAEDAYFNAAAQLPMELRGRGRR